MNDPYRLLGVSTGASQREIHAAYLRERTRLTESDEDSSTMSERLAELDSALDHLSSEARSAMQERRLVSDTGVRVAPPPPVARPCPRCGATVAVSATLCIACGSQVLALSQGTLAPYSAGNVRPCTHCGSAMPLQASTCAMCGQQLTRSCPGCSRHIELEQALCPHCGVVVNEYDQRRFGEAAAIEQQVQEKRQELTMKVAELERGHRERAVQGVFFWAGLFVVCVGVLVAVVVLATH